MANMRVICNHAVHKNWGTTRPSPCLAGQRSIGREYLDIVIVDKRLHFRRIEHVMLGPRAVLGL